MLTSSPFTKIFPPSKGSKPYGAQEFSPARTNHSSNSYDLSFLREKLILCNTPFRFKFSTVKPILSLMIHMDCSTNWPTIIFIKSSIVNVAVLLVATCFPSLKTVLIGDSKYFVEMVGNINNGYSLRFQELDNAK